MATTLPSLASSARKTAPMPPSPSFSSRRKRPSRSGTSSAASTPPAAEPVRLRQHLGQLPGPLQRLAGRQRQSAVQPLLQAVAGGPLQHQVRRRLLQPQLLHPQGGGVAQQHRPAQPPRQGLPPAVVLP